VKNHLWLSLILLSLATVATAGELPDKPQSHNFWTSNTLFVLASAANAGAISYDAYTTAVRHKGCMETAAILGRNPRNGELAAVSAGQFALLEAGSYLLKRMNGLKLHNLWPAPIATLSTMHIHAGLHNETVCD
jgi:hypothetical protein